jgi:hypothetical protein
VCLAAPCDVILDDTTVVAPDLLFVSTGRKQLLSNRGITGAPDLVVEILSESSERRDRGAKRQLYARYGVARYWIVDIDGQSLEIYALRDDAYVLAGTPIAVTTRSIATCRQGSRFGLGRFGWRGNSSRKTPSPPR